MAQRSYHLSRLGCVHCHGQQIHRSVFDSTGYSVPFEYEVRIQPMFHCQTRDLAASFHIVETVLGTRLRLGARKGNVVPAQCLVHPSDGLQSD